MPTKPDVLPDVFVSPSVRKVTTPDGAVTADFLLPGDLQEAGLLYSMGQQGREPRYATFVDAIEAVIQGRKRENEKLIALLEKEKENRKAPTES